MIRDIGKVILASKLPGKYAEIEDRMMTSGERDYLVEKELLGTTHAEIGAYLLDVWGLPVDIVDSVALHHLPKPNGENSLEVLAAVHVGGTIGDTWEISHPPPDPTQFLDMAFLSAAGLDKKVSSWLVIAQEHWRKMKKS